MSGKIPKNVSERTKRLVALAAEELSEASDSDLDSEDSYVPDEDELVSSEHETDTELEEGPSEEEVDANVSIPNHHLLSDSDTSDVENISDSEAADDSNETKYFGKKKCFSWSSVPQCAPNSRTTHNIIQIRISKPIGPALALGDMPTPLDIWHLFFTNDIVEELVLRTNEKLESVRKKLKNPTDPSYKNTSVKEMSALLGLLVLCCIFKSSRESLNSLFSTGITGRPIFRAIMSEKRCHILLRAMRFDDSSTRSARAETDPAAPISDIYNALMKNFMSNYSIGAFACVDETLVPFRGRCRFKMFMPKKPAKYGLKCVCITDSKNSYLWNSYMYTGKGSDGQTLNETEKKFQKPTQALIRLTRNLKDTHRNITCDNWFTSIEAAKWLWENGLTIVGTLRGNKPQIPPEFLPQKDRPVNSSLYGFTKELTLVSFVPKKCKAVIVLSSMHHQEHMDAVNGKPEIISLYNATKAGVDILDMKCSNYCANRRTRRWPLAIFYHLIAVSCCNAHTLYKHFKSKDLSRFDFMHQLALSLISDHLQERLKIPNLTSSLRDFISEALGIDKALPSRSTPKTDKLEKRKNCRYCPYQKNRMTSYKCVNCNTPSCLECSKKLCNLCVEKMCTGT